MSEMLWNVCSEWTSLGAPKSSARIFFDIVRPLHFAKPVPVLLNGIVDSRRSRRTLRIGHFAHSVIRCG